MRTWMKKGCLGLAAALLACATASAQEIKVGPFQTTDNDQSTVDPERFTDFTQVFMVPQFDDMGGERTLKSIKILYSLGLRFAGTATNNNPDPANATVTYDASNTISGPGFSEMIDINEVEAVNNIPGTNQQMNPANRTIDVGRVVSATDVCIFIDSADWGLWTGLGTVNVTVDAEGNVVASGPGNFATAVMTLGSGVFCVIYEFNTDEEDCPLGECDVPDYCEGFGPDGSCNGAVHDFELCGKYIDGSLEKRMELLCEPDTFLVLFDKQGNIINRDDNGSDKGNGWASGLDDVRNYDGTPGPYGDGLDGIIANGDGTQSIRIGVTGRADGLDGNFNGFFQNAPHGQLGKFIVCVEFKTGEGDLVFPAILPNGTQIENPLTYTDEFITGAEAFHINYTLPLGTVKVDVNIDNQVACDELRNDVDFYCLCGLIPLCDYSIAQIGGLNCECLPTATCLGWFDKDCEPILWAVGNGSVVPEFAELFIVADVNGKALIAVSGAKDCDFDGLDDEAAFPEARAPIECPEPTPGHGEAGCYTLCIMVIGDHGGGTQTGDEGGSSGDAAAMEQALQHGDLNMDGITNTADLGILLGSFGWTAQ